MEGSTIITGSRPGCFGASQVVSGNIGSRVRRATRAPLGPVTGPIHPSFVAQGADH